MYPGRLPGQTPPRWGVLVQRWADSSDHDDAGELRGSPRVRRVVVQFAPRAHVSSALRHLRFSVIAAGGALSIALILQMLVFAFIHFTDVRFDELQPETQTNSLRVVRTDSTAISLSGKGSAIPARAVKETTSNASDEPAEVNRVLNRNNLWLNITSDLARTVGFVSAIVLVFSMFQGVVIAGGASVPGIELAVTAGTWSLAIALACLPIGTLLPGIAFPGALPSYSWVIAASEALRSGAGASVSPILFYSAGLLTPMVVLVMTAVVVSRFLAGVEQGVIVTSMSELDEKLQREMSSIKIGSSSTPRSVGALHRAIGETPAEHTPMAASGSAPANGASQRKIGQPTAGVMRKRPI